MDEYERLYDGARAPASNLSARRCSTLSLIDPATAPVAFSAIACQSGAVRIETIKITAPRRFRKSIAGRARKNGPASGKGARGQVWPPGWWMGRGGSFCLSHIGVVRYWTKVGHVTASPTPQPSMQSPAGHSTKDHEGKSALSKQHSPTPQHEAEHPEQRRHHVHGDEHAKHQRVVEEGRGVPIDRDRRD